MFTWSSFLSFVILLICWLLSTLRRKKFCFSFVTAPCTSWKNDHVCGWKDVIWYLMVQNHRIKEDGKDHKVIKSNLWLNTFLSAKPQHQVLCPAVSITPSGMVTPPRPWAPCSNVSPLFQWRNAPWCPTWTCPGASSVHFLSSCNLLLGRGHWPPPCCNLLSRSCRKQ